MPVRQIDRKIIISPSSIGRVHRGNSRLNKRGSKVKVPSPDESNHRNDCKQRFEFAFQLWFSSFPLWPWKKHGLPYLQRPREDSYSLASKIDIRSLQGPEFAMLIKSMKPPCLGFASCFTQGEILAPLAPQWSSKRKNEEIDCIAHWFGIAKIKNYFLQQEDENPVSEFKFLFFDA